jgi:hypothetical protein
MTIKSAAKFVLGDSNYAYLRNLRYTRAANFLSEAPKFPKQIMQQHFNSPYFPFDFGAKLGFGAMLTQITLLLKYAEQNSLAPLCRISNPLYSSKRDIFPDFFVARTDHTRDPRSLFFHNFSNDYRLFKPRQQLQLNEMNRLFFKYIDFNERVRATVDSFYETVCAEHFNVGIHYRGTDKVIEAPEVAYERVFGAVEKFKSRIGTSPIFLATDSLGFSLAVRQRFPEIRFAMFGFDLKMTGELPRHFSPSISPDDKAMEAIVNMILLAKCKICIRTCSQLSLWSAVINKDLEIVTLNRPHNDFLENQLWERSLV